MNNQSSKIYLFYCSNSLDPIELMQGNGEHMDEFKAIPLPCSGKIDILYLTKAFETGADGAVVVTCKPGECRYLEGNLRAKKRVEAIGALLEEIGVGKGRTAVIQMSDGGIKEILHDLENFRMKIRALPGQS